MHHRFRFSRFVPIACFCLFLANQVRADIVTLNITSGSLVLTGNAEVVGVGTFNYVEQGAGSLSTTYGGSFSVNVDNVFAPSNITFTAANVDANTNGTWSPNNAGNSQTPASLADYGVRVNQILANGKLRNIVFNVTSGLAPVVGGNFAVGTQSWSYTTGNIDMFSDVLNDGTSATLTGTASNTNANVGTYSVAGNIITMTVPISIALPYSIPGNPTVNGSNIFTGTLTAIAAVPEPGTIALASVGILLVGGMAMRRRRQSLGETPTR